MNHADDSTLPADAVTIERWEDANPPWTVTALHSVITTAPDGTLLDEVEVEVQHRETGEVVNGVGIDLVMALALVTHRISEQD